MFQSQNAQWWEGQFLYWDVSSPFWIPQALLLTQANVLASGRNVKGNTFKGNVEDHLATNILEVTSSL